ncbi:MAG TPA: formylglycine-generating enzyme family protein, partial [Saprospiraceae bacterium]|nr:formylglycine-generating enzyme family protein [Saprospiraceae bacterium]
GEDEKPVHEVELSDFQLARTETTVWQYNLCLAATGRNMLDKKVKSKPGWGWEGDNPIVNVSWYDAVVYANWLSRQWGRTPAYTIDSVGRTQSDWKIELADQADGFRLPTEAEWEYAARGGSQQYAYRYAGGDSLELVARFRENSSNRAQPVTSRLPVKPDPDNPQTWLYDMSGNVYEWCGDWYDEGYYQKLRDVPEKNPKGPPDGSSRVLRGGSWDDRSSNFCRVASRGNYVPRSRYVIFGFRLAQDK